MYILPGTCRYVPSNVLSKTVWSKKVETVYPKKYAHGFVVLCFVVVMQSFIMNSHEVFIHIHQGCFAGTRAIVRLPQCRWSKPDGYGKISQCITTTKHSKAKTVCIFLGIYCSAWSFCRRWFFFSNISIQGIYSYRCSSAKVQPRRLVNGILIKIDHDCGTYVTVWHLIIW